MDLPFAASFADSKTRVKRGADGKSVFAERLRATNLEQGAVVDPARGAVVHPARGAVVHLARGAVVHLARGWVVHLAQGAVLHPARGAVLHLERDRGTAPLGWQIPTHSGGIYTPT